MTLAHWNPSTPARVGLELPVPLAAGGRKILATTVARGWRQTYRGESADSVTDATPLRSAPRPNAGRNVDNTYGCYILEVFADGDEIPSWSAWTRYAPNLIPTQATDWQGYDGASTQATARPDEIDGGATPNDADYIYTTGPKNDEVEINVGSGAAAITGKRVQARILVRLARDGNDSAAYDVGFTTNSGTTICWVGRADNSDHYTEDFETFYFDLPEINPFTGYHWSEADIQAFDAASRIVLRKVGRKDGQHVSEVNLEVRTATENRVALGFHKHTDAENLIDDSITMSVPTAVTAWSKGSGTTYSWVLRPMFVGHRLGADEIIVDDGTTVDSWQPSPPSVPYLHGPTDPGWTGYDVSVCTLDDRGDVTDADDDTVLEDGAYARMVFNAYTDGHPYVAVREIAVSTGVGANEQAISSPANDTYDVVEVICRYAAGAKPTADLTVQVLRNSDNAVFGTGTITTDMIDEETDIGGGWTSVTLPLTSTVALVSGTDYDIVFSSSTPDTAPFYVQALDIQTDGTTTDADADGSTFGGAESATIGGSDRDEADFVTWLFKLPAATSDFAAASGMAASGWTDDADQHGRVYDLPPGVPYAALTWTDSSVTGFARYTIQRQDTVDAVWRTIAQITTEADVTFDDYECRVGVVTSYRMRTETSDGPGAWTSTITHEPIVAKPAMWLTSNEDRTQVFAVLQVHGKRPVHDFALEEANAAVAIPIHGRDMAVVFRPTERSGVTFSRTVIVNSTIGGSQPAGPEAYRELVDMTVDPDLSYICVRDHIGNRFLAAVTAPSISAVTLGDAEMLYADLGVRETNPTPTTVAA